MKIVFVLQHKFWGGVNNNGGSKTIIRSAETLKELGHKVAIWTHTNKYKWHKPKIEITNSINKNRYDVAVAASVADIGIVRGEFKCRKFWWCRGLELWQLPEKKIIQKAKRIEVLVNSKWLLQKIPHARLCHAGLDLHFWKEMRTVKHRKKTIGCLYSKRHKTKNYKLFKKLRREFGDIFNYKTLKDKFNDKQLLEFYNECDIWFAPTVLEGWHNCPAEANLCGNLVVCNCMPSNGMDYATEKTAMRYTSWDELLALLENPEFKKVEKMQKFLREKIGSREDNMKRFVKLIGG